MDPDLVIGTVENRFSRSLSVGRGVSAAHTLIHLLEIEGYGVHAAFTTEEVFQIVDLLLESASRSRDFESVQREPTK